MKKNINYLLVSVAVLFFLSCANKKSDDGAPKPETVMGSNLRLGADDAQICEGFYPRRTVYTPDTMDNAFFIRHFPHSVTPPTPLIIAIHGGAFIGGDMFELPVMVQNIGFNNYTVLTEEDLNESGFAFASIDYTLMNSKKKVTNADGELVNVTSKNSMEDCQDFLDYMILNADLYNIDPTKIILLGSSAGASTSLWLGLDNNKNYTNNIRGIIAMSPQASLNFQRWKETIFVPTNLGSVYDANFTAPVNISGYSLSEYYKMMYGIGDITKVNKIDQYCVANHLNFLDLIDGSDPELFLSCFYSPGDIVHNRAHVYALKAKAAYKGLPAKIAYINSYYYNPDENIIQFCIRKCQ